MTNTIDAPRTVEELRADALTEIALIHSRCADIERNVKKLDGIASRIDEHVRSRQ